MKTEVLEKTGSKVVLLGNEAIARGALEAGVGVITAYPGTPSSEVPMILSRLAKDQNFYFEYSTNEKVAIETAAGAAWSGVRSLCTMKHFGLNVASDSLIPIAYTGVNAGLVVFVADDPQAWCSTQSEQDSRYYARLAKIPMLEPSNPQECLEFTKLAFEISEEFKIPVFLRTTTKVSHSIGTVALGELTNAETEGIFEKDYEQFCNFRPALQGLHQKLNEKIKQVESERGSLGLSSDGRELSPDPSEPRSYSTLNKIFPGNGEIGLITSGVSFEYAKEACQILKINPPIAKLGLTHPISKEFIANFIKDKKEVVIIEELEPIVEQFVKRVAKDINPDLKIWGKSERGSGEGEPRSYLPRVGEYNLEIVISALEKVFNTQHTINFEEHKEKVAEATTNIPPRKPVMCSGCPHRSTFYAVKKVFGKETTYIGDIGCVMLGVFEPFEMQDVVLSMGAGVSIAHGISRVSDQEVVTFIGDSTFFHAGMPALLNHKYNDDRSPLVVVMDNGITAMTGHQPHPGTGVTGMGEKVEKVKIDEVVKAFGAEVRVANAFSHKSLVAALEELKEIKGPRVLVSRGECRLLTKRKLRKKGLTFSTFKVVDSAAFQQSGLMNEFTCPAFGKTDDKYYIDEDLCWGCVVCSQICPKGIRKNEV